MSCEEYILASTVEEALAALASLRGEGRLIAGGTDLVLQLQHGERKARCLVDITRIPGLNEIRWQDSYIVIGAAVTFAQIERSALIRQRATVLAEAASWVGSPQIRNVGTLAGNIVNAQPAADGAIALLALDAEAEIANLTGRQWVALANLFVSPGVSRVDASSEMITAFRFRAHGPREASAFERLARRKALALPLINVGVRVMLDAEGVRMRDVRISIGPVAPMPFRAQQAEAVLKNRVIDQDTLTEAVEAAVLESKPRSSLLRAGKEYRRELIRVLTRRALLRAIEAARG
nr:FAD binding domain-containing protein [Chloroflexota bacterium]